MMPRIRRILSLFLILSMLLPCAVSAAPEANREELVAAISAALAEELGTDITGIRILSIKKL